VSPPLLVDFYRQLPTPKRGGDLESWSARFQVALDAYRDQVSARYTEGTLQRLLTHPEVIARRAAVLALGLYGTIAANAATSACLHDPDEQVRQMAADALWAMWFRGDNDDHNEDLQRLIRLRDQSQALAGLTDLIRRSPDFAEAYNQRAILYFRMGEFHKSIADCEQVMRRNPHHFGAQAGMAQCYLKIKKHRAALRAFRQALRINPNLDDVQETIRELEDALGGGGSRDLK
jgi:tetratricopeptide (TPR) repeat protein